MGEIGYNRSRYRTFWCIPHMDSHENDTETERNQMTYEDFLMHLEQKIMGKLEEGETVKRVRILKNNNVKLDGFSYCVEGHRERPTVYVNQYYQEELLEDTVDEIADMVLKLQRESRLFPSHGVDQLMDFEKMRKRIHCRLISRDKNEELLKDVPWLPWLDLAIVFHFQIPERILEHATALIYTSHMEYWGVTIEDIYTAAAENMSEIQVFLEPMEHFLGTCGFDPLSSGMHILSNCQKEYGAAVIINPQVQRMCLQRLGESYYVLPSSVHELLLLPESLAVGPFELEQLIREVNTTCVRQEEYLSGHAYFYSEETGVLK